MWMDGSWDLSCLFDVMCANTIFFSAFCQLRGALSREMMVRLAGGRWGDEEYDGELEMVRHFARGEHDGDS